MDTTITIDVTALPLLDGVWNVDSRRSQIGFAVDEMWGLRTVNGVFRAYDGSLEIRDGAAAGLLTIVTESLDTGNERRDRHLRSPDFFDAERHPQIVFAATDVRPRDGDVTISGVLVLGSARVPLEIPATVDRTLDGALVLEGEATVSREAAGLAWNRLGMIRGDVVLRAQLTLELSAL
jgi:polyisoprenoid-binding protein YceI